MMERGDIGLCSRMSSDSGSDTSAEGKSGREAIVVGVMNGHAGWDDIVKV